MNAESRSINEDVRSPEKSAESRKPGAPPAGTMTVRKKTLAIVSGVTLAALLISYGVGRMHGAERVTAIKQQADQELKAMIAQTAETNEKLQATTQKSLRLEARRQLHLALLALDDRNFGTAGQHLQDASKLIETSGGQADSELTKLGRDLGQPDLVKVNEDIGQQRERILALVRLMDKQIPR